VIISKGLNDEVFVIRDLSLFIDIAVLIDDVNSNAIQFESGKINIMRLETFVKSDCVDCTFMAEMSDSRRDEPIIVSSFHDADRIIDGNHRLLKCKSDGLKECAVVVIKHDALSKYSELLGY